MNPPVTPDAGTVPQREAIRREAETAMSRARSALLLREPFFGCLAMRLRLQADESCAQLWTDGKTLGFHPAFAATLLAVTLEKPSCLVMAKAVSKIISCVIDSLRAILSSLRFAAVCAQIFPISYCIAITLVILL